MLISVTCGSSSSAVGSGGSGNRGSAPGPEQVPDAVKMCGATSGGIASLTISPKTMRMPALDFGRPEGEPPPRNWASCRATRTVRTSRSMSQRRSAPNPLTRWPLPWILSPMRKMGRSQAARVDLPLSFAGRNSGPGVYPHAPIRTHTG